MKVPKGTSEYQATWILDEGEESEDAEESSGSEDDEMMEDEHDKMMEDKDDSESQVQK